MLVGAAIVAGCAGTPRTESKRAALGQDAVAVRDLMLKKNTSLSSLLDQSAGYIVFPEVKEGGFIVGAALANGVIFQHGKQAGFAELTRASVGAEIGGQKYSEIVAVKDQATLDKIKAGNFGFGAGASAIILHEAASTVTTFGANGVAVIVDPIGGAMVNASVNSQRIKTTM